MKSLDQLKIYNYLDYQNRLNTQKQITKEVHHVLSLQIFWPDIQENKVQLYQWDHVEIHKMQDIPYRYRSQMIRKQRMRENGHMVITENDLKGRHEIQWLYLEWSSKLPKAIQDINNYKLWQLLKYENKVNAQIDIPKIESQNKDLLSIHQDYIQAQIERSNYIYKLLKK